MAFVRTLLTLFFASALAFSACSTRDDRSARQREQARAAAEPERPSGAGASRTAGADTARPNEGKPRIVILGDSLTAGLGLPIEQAYPSLLHVAGSRRHKPEAARSAAACAWSIAEASGPGEQRSES